VKARNTPKARWIERVCVSLNTSGKPVALENVKGRGEAM